MRRSSQPATLAATQPATLAAALASYRVLPRRAAGAATSIVAALALSACAGSGLELEGLQADSGGAAVARTEGASAAIATGIETGSISRSALPPPSQATASAITEARALRDKGDLAAAAQHLDKAARSAPGDVALLTERGLLALERGNIAEAKALLSQADARGPADWRVKSALGSAHAAGGQQQAAQRAFAAALALSPDNPSIVNNLALSYALDGRRAEAEKLLRKAAASKTVAAKAKQNLALIVGLDGRIDEARSLSRASLPDDAASANVSYLEQLTSGRRVSRALAPETMEGTAATAAAADVGSAR